MVCLYASHILTDTPLGDEDGEREASGGERRPPQSCHVNQSSRSSYDLLHARTLGRPRVVEVLKVPTYRS